MNFKREMMGFIVEVEAKDVPGEWLFWSGPFSSKKEAETAMEKSKSYPNNRGIEFRIKEDFRIIKDTK